MSQTRNRTNQAACLQNMETLEGWATKPCRAGDLNHGHVKAKQCSHCNQGGTERNTLVEEASLQRWDDGETRRNRGKTARVPGGQAGFLRVASGRVPYTLTINPLFN